MTTPSQRTAMKRSRRKVENIPSHTPSPAEQVAAIIDADAESGAPPSPLVAMADGLAFIAAESVALANAISAEFLDAARLDADGRAAYRPPSISELARRAGMEPRTAQLIVKRARMRRAQAEFVRCVRSWSQRGRADGAATGKGRSKRG